METQNVRIVAADNIKGSGLELLRNYFGTDAVITSGKQTEEDLIRDIGSMDALLIRSATTVSVKALANSTRLKVIGRAGVGVDNIDRQAATEKGIIVMNTPFGNTVSAAEQAIALIFATARNTAKADALMQQGKWEKKALVGSEVSGKTLGLLGLGRIGSHVAQVMKAASMKIIAYDPYLSPERAAQMGVELVDIDNLLARSDFVSIHTPLTDSTRNLLDAKNLAKMKPSARLINCARGGIVDEAALAEAVKSGKLAAAGFDVFSKEPMTEGPLFGVPGITLTPHLGASTEEAEERCCQQLAEQIISFFRDGEIHNAVNVRMDFKKSLQPYCQVAKALGNIGTTLLGAAPAQVEIACSGEMLGQEDTGLIRAMALIGVIDACHLDIDSLNPINADVIAKQRGISVIHHQNRPAGTYANLVEVTVSGGGKSVRVGGTAYDNVTPRVVFVDKYNVDITPGGVYLFMTYPDRPGYVGKFGTILSKHNINIASMDVGRETKFGQALVVLGLDDCPSQAALDEILAVEGVQVAKLLEL